MLITGCASFSTGIAQMTSIFVEIVPPFPVGGISFSPQPSDRLRSSWPARGNGPILASRGNTGRRRETWKPHGPSTNGWLNRRPQERPFSTCDVEDALFCPLLTLCSQWISQCQCYRYTGTTMAAEDAEWMIEGRGHGSGAESIIVRVVADIDRDRSRERTTALVSPRSLIAFARSTV